MKKFLAAFSFLTVFPVPESDTRDETISGSVFYFPLVGLFLGAVYGGLAVGVVRLLPPWPTAILLVSAMAWFTGALHLDGLADTADGFFSSRPRDRMLQIMRDSHIGSMGVVALVLLLLFKAACIASLPPAWLPRVALLVPIAGRCAMVIHLSLLKYARDEGLGKLYFDDRTRVELSWAILFLVLVSALAAGRVGLIGALGTLLFSVIWCFYVRHKLGGGTGDTAGAASELAECLPALAFLLAQGNAA